MNLNHPVALLLYWRNRAALEVSDWAKSTELKGNENLKGDIDPERRHKARFLVPRYFYDTDHRPHELVSNEAVYKY